MPRRQIIAPVVVPLLAGGLLVQSVSPLARLVTTYRALDLGLGAQAVALLSAVFALLPVVLMVRIGRANDRGLAAAVTVGGAALVLSACVALWLLPPSLPMLLAATAVLGIGTTMCLASLQVIVAASASRAHRDALLGNYMVAISLGQALGPLFLALPREGGLIGVVPVLGALLLLGAALALLRARPRRRRPGDDALPLGRIAATRGLPWIVLTGALCVTAQDLILAFLPLLGEERGIAPAVVGLLLSARAGAAMVSRLAFGRAVRLLGRMPLMLAAATLSGAGLLLLAAALPLWAVAGALAAAGFGLGLALTSSIALIMEIAPPAARGTALSLRLTANRIAQFSLPLAAGLVVAPLGVAGIFGLSGVALLAAAAARPRQVGGSA